MSARPDSGAPAGGPTIQPVGACDIVVLAELNRRCFAEAGDGGFVGMPWTARSLAEVLALPGAFGLLALEAGAPVGFLLAQGLFEDAEILSLGVLAARRRAGHGRRLLRAAAVAARRQGARRLLLEVADSNAVAQAFYLAEGFRPTGRRRNYYLLPGGAQLDAVIFGRDLEAFAGPPA